MYYKLENKESKIYKKLFDFRKNELRIEASNETKIKERYPNWNGEYVGYRGQQQTSRVNTYVGLGFYDSNSINPKEFKKNEEYNGIYMPNKKTQKGKDAAKFLTDLETSSFFKLRNMLGMELMGQYCFPFIEIGIDDVIACYFDDKYTPSEEFIEITSKEFDLLRTIPTEKQ